MSPHATVLLLGFSVILQTTLLPRLAIGGVKPNLPLILVGLLALQRGTRQAILWALVGGLLLDLLSGAPFGIGTLSLLAVAVACGWQRLRDFHAPFLLPMAVVAAASLIHDVLFLSLLGVGGWPVNWTDNLFLLILPGALFNAVLAPLIGPVLRWTSGSGIEEPKF